MEKYYRARQVTEDNMLWNTHIRCWITKASDTHSEYVILVAFPPQQWLHGHNSMFRYTYSACPVLMNRLCQNTVCTRTAGWKFAWNSTKSKKTFSCNRPQV